MPSLYKLSIIIPVYNERNTIRELVNRVETVPFAHPIQIIIVDDGSTDGTRELLVDLQDQHTVVLQEKNGGKGSAIRAGIRHVNGTHVVIQDADLEYDPHDLDTMFLHMLEHDLPVLYGSRSIERGRNKEAGFSFYWGGQFLTVLANVLYGQALTDEPTCYKMFRHEVLRELPLRCERFEFCPEVTAQVAKRGIKIKEIPISYYPRSAAEGKKIKWRDGVEAIQVLVRERFLR